MDYDLEIRLDEYEGSCEVELDGERGIFIPYKPNGIYQRGKRGITSYARAFNKPFNAKGETHNIALSISSDNKEKLHLPQDYIRVIGTMKVAKQAKFKFNKDNINLKQRLNDLENI